jgi:hypothetical protein
MCISMGPGTVFSGVVTAGFQLAQNRHAIAYMNHATPDPRARRVSQGANCMLLHVPGLIERLVPSQDNGDFLKQMGDVVPALTPAMTLGMTRGGFDPMMASFGFSVVEYGAYEVVLATTASVIGKALKEVSPAKRPTVNPELLQWYGDNYPDCAFVLACFNNDVEVADHPIVLTYEPHNPEVLFAPGLESHTGEPPALGAHEGNRDFKVVFGSLLADEGTGNSWRPVEYRPNGGDYGLRGGFIQCPEPVSYGQLDAILPNRVVGFYDEHSGANQDYVAEVADVLAGITGKGLFQTMPEHFYGSHFDPAMH